MTSILVLSSLDIKQSKESGSKNISEGRSIRQSETRSAKESEGKNMKERDVKNIIKGRESVGRVVKETESRLSKRESERTLTSGLSGDLKREFCSRMFDLERPDKMSKFLRGLLLPLVSEAMDQLQILKDINQINEDDADAHKFNFIQYRTIEERYMGSENHAECRIDSSNNNFDKLAGDIQVILQILKLTCREIHYHGTFENLHKSIKVLNQMHIEEVQLLHDEQNSEKVIADLKTQLEKERLDNIKTVEETNAKIQKLKFEVEDMLIYGQHEVDYYDKWEKSRNEQHSMKCQAKENYFQNIIDTMQTNMDWENRCHTELMTFLTETRDDFLDDIQYWMKRYDEDMESKESDLIQLKAAVEKLMEDHLHLQEEYDRREIEISDFLEYKRIQLEKRVEEYRRNRAARKIQAWWRAVMKRKKLGPYSKKKKGKGKGKEKGKGKGKGKGKKK